MNAPTFSLVVNHTPWRPERVRSWHEMLRALGGVPARTETDEYYDAGTGYVAPSCRAFLLNDHDYRGTDWQVSKVQWALQQWHWSVMHEVTHHVFMTDDLHLIPGFWDVLSALVSVAPKNPIGLLSNHPRGPALSREGHVWYATNSWIVGPAYVLPHAQLIDFLAYFMALPDGDWRMPGSRGYRNDDSSINEWVTFGPGGPRRTLHPLPTIVEHRADLESTVGHGDQFSRERLSWRFERDVEWVGDCSGRFRWTELPVAFPPGVIAFPSFWQQKGGPDAAPLLQVGG